MTEIFYIFDDGANIKNFFYQRKGGEGRVFLIPLTINDEYISNTFQNISFSNKNEIVLIPFVQLFSKKAFSVRDDYIKFIYNFGEIKILGKKNLKEYFKPLLGNFSTWWFSLIAEKNTAKTDSYHNLVKLLVILDLQKKYNCKKFLLDIGNPKLAHALMDNIGIENCKDLRKHKKRIEFLYILFLIAKTMKSIVGKYKNILWITVTMRGLNSRKNILQNSKYLIVTYFPLVDQNALKERRFIDKYYEPLQSALTKKYNGKLTWLAMVIKNEDFSYKESIFLGKEINKWGNSLFFSDEWLNFFDFFLGGIEYLYIATKFLVKLPFISSRFNFQCVKIWEIFKDDWSNSFCGRVFLEGFLYYRAFNRILGHLQKGAITIYLAENHAWEKSLNIASHLRKALKTIGIQHSIVPLLLLNYFNDRKELENGNYTQTIPKPDFLGCAGRIPFELLQKGGWNKKELFILGGVRYQYLENCLKSQISWGEKENKAVVALSIMPEEAKETLLWVYHAFKDSLGLKVMIKGHPFLDAKELIRSLNLEFDEKIFQVVKVPLSDLLSKAKCLIVTESTVTLEGIAFGCVVIIPRLISVVDMNPLSGISNLPIYVETPEELRKVLIKIIEKKESPVSYDKYENTIRSYFEFPDSNDEFLQRIEQKADEVLANR